MNNWRKTIPVLSLVIATATMAVSQDRSQVKSDPPSRQESKTASDETFELNITERHITEKNFEASTAVEIGPQDQKDLRLQIGVALRADTIDVVLRNVTGTVRFRGSVQSILDRINARPKAVPPR